MLVSLQLRTAALVPFSETVLLPWVDPKFDPAIVTDAPTTPLVALKLVILGAANASPDSIIDTDTKLASRPAICVTVRSSSTAGE
jgi:hypothetical protein